MLKFHLIFLFSCLLRDHLFNSYCSIVVNVYVLVAIRQYWFKKVILNYRNQSVLTLSCLFFL